MTKAVLESLNMDSGYGEDLISWNDDTALSLGKEVLQKIHLPHEDFADANFDKNVETEARQIFLLLSTPRSGSTAICDYLYKKTNLVTHEYFQPFQYMPVLAYRWQSVKDGYLDPERYAKGLLKHRISENGTLGINLHGSHIGIFSYFEKYLSSLPKFVLVIRRRNKVAQAVSYYIASHSKKWSSHFDAENPLPSYSYEGIKIKLFSILQQELVIDFYLKENAFFSQTIYYESISSKGSQLEGIMAKQLGVDEINLQLAETQKQSDEINIDYAEKFWKQLQFGSRKYVRELQSGFS